MDGLLRRLGRTAGPVKDRIAKLKLDLQYPNPTSEESRAQIMRDIDGIIRDAEKRAALLFDVRPKAPVVVRSRSRASARPMPPPITTLRRPTAPDPASSRSRGASNA